MLTIQEAVWHQKPVLGIPLDVIQQKSSQRAVDLGFAETIDVHNFTAVQIIAKVRMLVENPIYLRSVEKVSALMKISFAMSPTETAIYWIKQVIQHKGLDHLKIEVRRLNFFQLYMLDVAFLISIIILIYILLMQYHIVKNWVLNRERKRRAAEEKVMSETDKLKNE